MLLSVVIVIGLLIFKGESTEIAAVYKHDIIVLKNADNISPKLPLNPEHLKVDLPRKFAYPTAISYEPFTSTFFVADINDNNTEIFSFSLKKSPVIVQPLVSRRKSSAGKSSAVNTIVYDPLSHELLWTDSENHGVYSFNTSSPLDSLPSKLFTDQRILKPRGIALDYCNKMLYWTERDNKSFPTIEMADLEKGSVQTLKESKDETYYQAINYDQIHHELVWAETKGDDPDNASCRIVVKSLDTGVESLMQSFEGCYPFALTSDREHIYWSDWTMNGIMRLSRKHPNNSLVKLVNTPSVNSDEGRHISAFGIVNVQNISEEDLCSVRDSELTQSTQTEENISGERSSEGNLTSQLPDTLSTEREINGEIQTPVQEKEILYPGMRSSASSIICGAMQHRLRLVIILVTSACLFFMVTTLLFLLRNFGPRQRYMEALKGLFATLPATATSVSPQIKKLKAHRRFGPKSKLEGGRLCPRDASDGVKIDIEDCCQMTLCDTPCYTTIKKEGKSYKNKSTTKTEDKENLLDEEA